MYEELVEEKPHIDKIGNENRAPCKYIKLLQRSKQENKQNSIVVHVKLTYYFFSFKNIHLSVPFELKPHLVCKFNATHFSIKIFTCLPNCSLSFPKGHFGKHIYIADFLCFTYMNSRPCQARVCNSSIVVQIQ